MARNDDYALLERPYPRVPLHPMTIKYMKKGHPWVTLDKFSQQFPGHRTFLIGTNGKGVENSVLLHDPHHKTIRARVWSQKSPYVEQVKNFEEDLDNRIKEALIKRQKLIDSKERDNYYIIFGEADRIPGVMVQKLDDTILIQFYAGYWSKLFKFFIRLLAKNLEEQFPGQKFSCWLQERNKERSINIRPLKFKHSGKAEQAETTISEFGVKYKLVFDKSYDFGLYTDMSAIRKSLTKYFEKANSVLNLYSYTGAYSLYALKCGAKETTSVDLSPKYLSWLDENIALNEFDGTNTNMQMAVDKALDKLKSENKKFDFIICDPPSASSDGKKVTKAINAYNSLLPKLVKATNEGGHIAVFLNTHSITWKKFESHINQLLKERLGKHKITIEKKLNLMDDCPRQSGFFEGDYLKGLLLKVHN